MSEYIITINDQQRWDACKRKYTSFFGFPIAEREVVRCADCRHYDPTWKHDYRDACWCDRWANFTPRDGYCHRGQRTRWLTCHCGHEMEAEGTCPMCGRYVREDEK